MKRMILWSAAVSRRRSGVDACALTKLDYGAVQRTASFEVCSIDGLVLADLRVVITLCD